MVGCAIASADSRRQGGLGGAGTGTVRVGLSAGLKRRPTDAPVTRNGQSGGRKRRGQGRARSRARQRARCRAVRVRLRVTPKTGSDKEVNEAWPDARDPGRVGEDAGRAAVGQGAWPCRPNLEGDKAQRGGRRGAYPNMCYVCDAERPGGKLRLGAGIGRLALSPSAGGATTTRVPCRAPSESPEVQGHRARPSESTVHINPHKTPQTEISVWLR